MSVKKIVIALLAMTILAATLYAKGEQESSNSTTIRTGANMFTSGGKGSLTINNLASFDVIIFAGRVTNNNVMGGIRAGQSRNFDLSTLSLPGKNGSFLIRATSFEQYNKRSARVTEEDVLYTGLVVYDLNNPNDRTNINIYAGISQAQQEYIYVSNTSQFVLELRVDTPNGDKIATLAPFQGNKKLYIKPKDDGLPYDFYATYVYIDPRDNEMKSFVTTDRSGRQRELPKIEGVAPLEFTGPKDTSQIAYIIGFLRLKNETGEGLDLRDSGRILPDQKGRRFVARGELQTFELTAQSGQAGQLYTGLYMEMDNTQRIPVNNFLVRPGVVYDMVVTKSNGNYAYDIRETATRDRLEDMRIELFLGG